jgi:RimJ/RimL family protein N-acetyltransferase
MHGRHSDNAFLDVDDDESGSWIDCGYRHDSGRFGVLACGDLGPLRSALFGEGAPRRGRKAARVRDDFPLRLVELDDADFDWLLSFGAKRADGLTLPPGGVDDPETLEHVRRLTRHLHASGSRNSWMAVVGNEVVGMIGHKTTPLDGTIEIGYGIAASRRGRGYATQAVAAVLLAARRNPDLRAVLAETLEDNLASQRVLIKNAFERSGGREDPADGPLVLWRFELRTG